MKLFRGRETETRTVEPVERRDPSAATKSLRYITQDKAQAPDWDAVAAWERAYYMTVVVYACVRLRANVVSSLKFRVGADPSKPHDYDPNHPLAQLLGPPPGGPAPKLSARRLWAWTTGQRMVTGRNGWEIETAAGDQKKIPLALWPLASSFLNPIPTTSGVQWFKGFEYGRAADTKRLGYDDVVYDWDPSGVDFRQPESALQAANLDVAVAVMQGKYDYAFLKNDARPPAIVVTEAFEDQDSFDAFKRQFNSQHQGPDNAGRMAFVEATGTAEGGVKGAVDVTVLGISPKDAQAAQRHTAAMERTAMALGTPWSLLDASGRTFSNAGQEWTNFVTLQVVPMLTDFQDMVNMQLAPRFGANVGWFDLEPLGISEKADPVTQTVGAPSLVQSQLMWINEARADYGLPPVTDGDRMMTADEIAALRGAGAPADVARMLEAFEARVLDKIEVRTLEPVVVPPAPVAVVVDHEQRRAKLWNTAVGKVRNLERSWERQLRKLFARQARATIQRLEGKRGRFLAGQTDVRALGDEIFDRAHWAAESLDDLEALYELATAAGGARVADLFGLAFDVEAPYAQEFIQARAMQLAGEITDTTYNAIRDTLAEGVAAGESVPELAARVRTVFEQASKTRAVTIARTEVLSAFNGSAALTASTYGPDVVAGQEWIATRDGRSRDSHVARDGQIRSIGEPFSGGLMYPGDPSGGPAETVNCRCTVAFLTPDDMPTGTGRNRMVETRVARAVLALVRPGMTEADVRSALREAA